MKNQEMKQKSKELGKIKTETEPTFLIAPEAHGCDSLGSFSVFFLFSFEV